MVSAMGRRSLLGGVGALLGALTLPGVADGDAPKESPPFMLQDGDSVMFVGDSITLQGYYCDIVQGLTLDKYEDRRIIWNRQGVGGDMIGGMHSRLDAVFAVKPNWVFLEDGINDSLQDIYPYGTPLPAFKETYAQVLRELRAGGCTVVCLTPTVCERTYAYHNANADLYADAIREIAMVQGVMVADVRKSFYEKLSVLNKQTDPPHLTGEGLHPTPLGATVMAMAILKAINW